MNSRERHADIVKLAKAQGHVAVEALAERFNVTAQTVRKDLNELCSNGVLKRTHGGACFLQASRTWNMKRGDA